MKLRSAQIGRPTWSELNETIIEYLKEAMREHDQPIKFELVPTGGAGILGDRPRGHHARKNLEEFAATARRECERRNRLKLVPDLERPGQALSLELVP